MISSIGSPSNITINLFYIDFNQFFHGLKQYLSCLHLILRMDCWAAWDGMHGVLGNVDASIVARPRPALAGHGRTWTLNLNEKLRGDWKKCFPALLQLLSYCCFTCLLVHLLPPCCRNLRQQPGARHKVSAKGPGIGCCNAFGKGCCK